MENVIRVMNIREVKEAFGDVEIKEEYTLVEGGSIRKTDGEMVLFVPFELFYEDYTYCRE
jgi:hypothetical protein